MKLLVSRFGEPESHSGQNVMKPGETRSRSVSKLDLYFQMLDPDVL